MTDIQERITELIEEVFNLRECPSVITEEVTPCKITESGVYKIKGTIKKDKIGIVIDGADKVILKGEKTTIFKPEIDASIPILINNSDYVKIEGVNISGSVNIGINDTNEVTIENSTLKYVEGSIFTKNVNKLTLKNVYVNSLLNTDFLVSENTQYIRLEDVKTNKNVDIFIGNSNTVKLIKSKHFNLHCSNVNNINIIDSKIKNQTYENVRDIYINEKEREIKFATV